MSKRSQESLSVEVGYKGLTMPSGNCTGLMKARGSFTGTKRPGKHRQTALFHQVLLSYHPLCRAA